eukprot:TRINITY_DN11311_c0_g1_i3.p1 TRINITY_DN11311_c0_g1~~TRINITY_DN11311_c0_g1_i3.p1  ORF type:complete len:256 (-),score=74.47 TRINITY_DN11311_c0_g1_i3:232-999(-)
MSDVFRELSNTRQTQDRLVLRRNSPGFHKPPKQRLTPDERKRIDYDIVSLKRSLNIYREENNKLKERAHNAKEELRSKKLYAKELNHNVHNLITMNKRTLMADPIDPKIREYISELEKEIKTVQKEKNALAQYARESRYHEVQAELKSSLEECRRLRGMIQAASAETVAEETDVHQLMLENKQLLKLIELRRREAEKAAQAKRGCRVRLRPKAVEKNPLKSKEDAVIEKEFRKIKQSLHERKVTGNHRVCCASEA